MTMELATHDNSVAALLALPFADAIAGSLLMLHLEELNRVRIAFEYAPCPGRNCIWTSGVQETLSPTAGRGNSPMIRFVLPDGTVKARIVLNAGMPESLKSVWAVAPCLN
jgi:hypothetical protein